MVADPIGGGFVTSLARPGGNITGFMGTETPLAGKWMQLLKEITPGMRRAGNSSPRNGRPMLAAAENRAMDRMSSAFEHDDLRQVFAQSK